MQALVVRLPGTLQAHLESDDGVQAQSPLVQRYPVMHELDHSKEDGWSLVGHLGI